MTDGIIFLTFVGFLVMFAVNSKTSSMTTSFSVFPFRGALAR